VIDSKVRQGVIQLSTGAWYEPEVRPDVGALCATGDPNVLTRDIGASGLSQGCIGQLALVDAEPAIGLNDNRP
jgi:biotin/methionine sulfoxide reductase